MAHACMLDLANSSRQYIEYLRARGKIIAYEKRAGWICFTFTDTLELDLDDYLSVQPGRKRHSLYGESLVDEFNRFIQTPVIESLRGGVVTEYLPGIRLVIKPASKSGAARSPATPEERRRLQEEAGGFLP